jgi:hypothetical protein
MKNTMNGLSAMFGRFAGRLFPAFLLVVLILSSGACKTEADDDNSGGSLQLPPLSISGSDSVADTYFYSLKDGQEVTGQAIYSGAWDIAINAHDNSFFFLTNSGVSAVKYTTGGKGGVWYTDNTNFNAVSGRTPPPQGEEYEPYNEDVTRYAILMSGVPLEETLNVITYLGYPSGNGLSPATPFTRQEPDQGNMPAYIPYLFNKKQAYSMVGMPPTYTPTNQVYIVKHGDGQGYSKIQLKDAFIEGTNFILEITYAPVE